MAPERSLRAAILGLALCAGASLAWGADAVVEVPQRDPWVPPELAQKARVEPASRGTALETEVERKLRSRFEAAAGPSGLLTREAARAAGLGLIDRHFDAIDRRHSGRVTYDDYRLFLVSRGAVLP